MITADEFDSRKVVARVDGVMKALYMFRRLESGDLECVSEIDSRSPSFCLNPRDVYFLYPEMASLYGGVPDPNQESNFPERISYFPCGPPDFLSVKAVSKEARGRFLSEAQIRSLATVGNGLEVCISRIPNSGRGVFATRDYEKGVIVTLYFGHSFGEKHRVMLQEAGRGTHAKPLHSKHQYLDGVKTVFKGMHAAQLLNHATGGMCNCAWAYLESRPITGERLLAVVAKRAIKAGEELYVSYGKKFWDELNIKPLHPPRSESLRCEPEITQLLSSGAIRRISLIIHSLDSKSWAVISVELGELIQDILDLIACSEV